MTQYTKPTVLPAWGESAGGADVLQPTNAEIQAGWPLSNVPPSRKRFNWILKYLAQGVRYMMQMGVPLWDAAEDYPVNARVMGSNGKTYKALQTSINQDPTTATAYWQVWGTEGRDDQLQLTTAFTTAGAAPNFTLTPSPAPAALTANLRFRVKFHAAGAGSDVINISGFGNKSVKQYDGTGTKVSAIIKANQLCDVEYDGVDLVILDPLPIGGGYAYNPVTALTATTTLLNTQAKGIFFLNNPGGLTITLPLLSTCNPGDTFTFMGGSATASTVQRQGTDIIVVSSGVTITAATLQDGAIFTFVNNGTQWSCISGTGIGSGQTWQNMSGSRALDTTYTNTTGKPIFVAYQGTYGSGASTYWTVKGVSGLSYISNANTNPQANSSWIIIPPGATYSCNIGAGSVTGLAAFELR